MTSTCPPRLLVANRGEIAIRVMRGARDEGWTPIAVYSEADAAAPHVTFADEAYPIGPAASSESYLKIPAIMEAARLARATHVHPGYGFLSENAEFPRACAENGLIFVGPSAESMDSMGNKVAARKTAEEAGVPLIPGSPPLPNDPAVALKEAETIGYPVLIKAAFGGGGKGMRLCHDPKELEQALALTRGEAGRAFGNDTIFLERGLIRPRHIEIQVLADQQGRAVWLGERECSIQRRHQKVIEETPSVAIDDATRTAMGEAAARLAERIGYVGAGTVEFLYDGQEFFFLEMNTRLQVEHPVTEATTGIDLVRAQLRIAQGEPLPFTQDEITRRGASIECRICAEDPAMNFVPSSGLIRWLQLPQGPGVRNDFGFEYGSEIPVHYDSMLGKLITWGATREVARERMRRALGEFVISGVPTNIAFLRWAIEHPEFISGNTHTGFIGEYFDPASLESSERTAEWALIGAVAAHRQRGGRASSPGATVHSGQSASPGSTSAPRITRWKRPGGWGLR